jgi:hypothetical protein
MRVLPMGPFEQYFKASDEVEKASLLEDAEGLRGLRVVHDYIADLLQRHGDAVGPLAVFLEFNSFMLLLAGMRTAISGHAAAIFPVLRTALESASYAYLMIDDQSLETIWSNRHRDKASLKACRKAFTSAVSMVAKKLNAIQADSGTYIEEIYEASIDFGAHPNTRSIFGHVNTEEDDEIVQVRLVGVYAHDAFEARRAVLACWDFGIAIAIILTRANGDLTQELADRLDDLNVKKEAYASSLVSPKS